MLKIAITGGIACGKSVLGRLMMQEGLVVCEADELARSLLEKQGDVSKAVRKEFGRQILLPDGQIDRKKLARLVFDDPAKLARLNSIVHPKTRKKWEEWLIGQEVSFRKTGKPKAAAVIIPLLYEAGFEDGWDAVICVIASSETQYARGAKAGLQDFAARKNSQMTMEEKAYRSDHVIVNSGTVELMREQLRRILTKIMEIKNGT